MSERKEVKSVKSVKSVKVSVESQGHVSGAPDTKSAKGEGRNPDEAQAMAEKKPKA